jgi:pyruvate-formate lyase-activating enzyme
MVDYTLKDLDMAEDKKGTAYLFDIDLIERSSYPTFPKLPNHALMKFSSYFKSQGYKVKLVYKAKLIPLFHKSRNVYVGSALYSGNLNRFKRRFENSKKFKKTLLLEHITIGTPLDTMPEQVERCLCDYAEYIDMVDRTDIKLGWWPVNVGFLTRGCYRKCKFCVNRDKTEIVPVNTLDEIYVNKGVRIELLDDNLFAYDGSPKLLREIGRFSTEHDVKFKLRNGLDCRKVTPERLAGLKASRHAFDALHCAWDETKNTFIFKNIMEVKKAYGGTVRCYTLCGVNIYTDEELYKDILGLFYRYYCLYKISVEPIVALFEDDTEQYVNPYWKLYKTIKHSYYMQIASGPSSLKRHTSKARMHLADKVIEILGEHSWLVEKKIGVIVDDPGLNDKLKVIAKELGVKHREIGTEYNKIRFLNYTKG